MTVFVDSSALVKLYVPERQHHAVRGRADPFVIASVTRVEVASALWRKHRLGEIDAADAAILCAAFEADLGDAGRIAVVELGSEILRLAVDSVARHALRAYDAVQLATAMTARDALGPLDGFVAFDAELRFAAATEGFAVLPDIVER